MKGLEKTTEEIREQVCLFLTDGPNLAGYHHLYPTNQHNPKPFTPRHATPWYAIMSKPNPAT
jgi:hypothetical protein